MRAITLTKASGEKFRLVLNNYGSGVDYLHRRWVLDSGGWNCIETGEVATRKPLLHSLLGGSATIPSKAV